MNINPLASLIQEGTHKRMGAPVQDEAGLAPQEFHEIAHEAEDHITSYLTGYGRGNVPGLVAIAERSNWPQLAAQELDRRATRFLANLSDNEMKCIADGTVNPATIAQRLLSQFANPTPTP